MAKKGHKKTLTPIGKTSHEQLPAILSGRRDASVAVGVVVPRFDSAAAVAHRVRWVDVTVMGGSVPIVSLGELALVAVPSHRAGLVLVLLLMLQMVDLIGAGLTPLMSMRHPVRDHAADRQGGHGRGRNGAIDGHVILQIVQLLLLRGGVHARARTGISRRV